MLWSSEQRCAAHSLINDNPYITDIDFVSKQSGTSGAYQQLYIVKAFLFQCIFHQRKQQGSEVLVAPFNQN